MDDIIISTKDNNTLQRILDIVKEKANKSNLSLNLEKEEGPASKITAFNIELSHNNLSISNDRINQFHLEYNKSQNKHQKLGIINYIKSVNKTQMQGFQ